MTTPLPENVTTQHLKYLDALRDSGVTNMFGASSYIVDRFGVDKREAKDILAFWMNSYPYNYDEIAESANVEEVDNEC